MKEETNKILVAQGELTTRKREIGERLRQLEQEKTAFQEIRDSLRDEEQVVLERLTLAKEEYAKAVEQLDARTQKTMALNEQSERVKREIALLLKRGEDNEKRKQELGQSIRATEQNVLFLQRQMQNASEKLELGREALVKMDRKITLTRGQKPRVKQRTSTE